MCEIHDDIEYNHVRFFFKLSIWYPTIQYVIITSSLYLVNVRELTNSITSLKKVYLIIELKKKEKKKEWGILVISILMLVSVSCAFYSTTTTVTSDCATVYIKNFKTFFFFFFWVYGKNKLITMVYELWVTVCTHSHSIMSYVW